MIKMKSDRLMKFGENRLLGYYEKYAIVLDEEYNELYYYESEPIECLIDSCVEVELLNPIKELPEKVQEQILQEYGYALE